MNPLTVIAIAQAAIQGIQSAAEAWPIVYAMFTQGHVPTANEQAILDRGADDAHAALQLARAPTELPVSLQSTAPVGDTGSGSTADPATLTSPDPATTV